MERFIDLRSDTVTQPTENMRKAMAIAEVGDDVCGEDPTVNRLEELAAQMSGKEAAIYVSSGTQSNLIALLSHCERGEEYIVGQLAHTYKYEAGGAAVLGSIQPQPIEFEPDGTLSLVKVDSVIKPDDFHFAKTKLLCLENTVSGKVLPLAYQTAAQKLAKDKGLEIHLDGARVCNAAVKLGIGINEICDFYDSVSICLSKGLAAPVGSVLCGSESFINNARRWRKMVGGGMRQAGIIAAAGILALTEQVDRLADDHENARILSEKLSGIKGIEVDMSHVQTNMVFVKIPIDKAQELSTHLNKNGIKIYPGSELRLVTHIDIKRDDLSMIADAFRGFFQN